MFESICTLPLSSELFTQALHPTEPILSVGLSSGHVQTFRLPEAPHDDEEEEDDSDDDTASKTHSLPSVNGTAVIDTTWRTRRHKGSCRCLTFSPDGDVLFSAGTDGLVKVAKTETGVVEAKIAIPPNSRGSSSNLDAPTILSAITPQTLLLATDSSALHFYDLRVPSATGSKTTLSSKPQQSHHPHDDYISSLTPLPPSATSTSGFPKQWVTTGGTTLAVTDLRRGVLVRSEDQGEELLSSVYVGGLPKTGTSVGEKIILGGAGGVLTLWEKGVWDDQDERITVDRGGEAIETLVQIPDSVSYHRGRGKMVAAGLADGRVKVVRLGANQVMHELQHDEIEGVIGLDFDCYGRMVTGGGETVKVWTESAAIVGGNAAGKRGFVGGSSDDDDSDDDQDSDDEQKRESGKTRRKRKRNKGKDRSAGKAVSMGFSGLD